MRRCFQIWASGLLFVLALFEVHDGNMLSLGKAVNLLHVFLPDLAKRSRGRNLVLPLPAQENADFTHGLQLRYVCLQEDAIDRSTPQRHVISEQSTIVGHDNPSNYEDNA